MPHPLRRHVRRQVAERTPNDAGEAATIARFLAEFDALADPFDIDADPVHVTGSAFVVGPRGVVLLHHRRLAKWLQPGGHLDPGETPWDAARREAIEETGLVVDFLERDRQGVPRLAHVDVHPGGRGHTHLDLRYVLGGDDRDPSPPADESQRVAWFDWEAAIERADDPHLAAALAALRPSA